MRGGVLPMGPSSGVRLYYDLSQMIVVRDGLGVRVGRCLGAVCLAIRTRWGLVLSLLVASLISACVQ